MNVTISQLHTLLAIIMMIVINLVGDVEKQIYAFFYKFFSPSTETFYTFSQVQYQNFLSKNF